MIVIGKCVEIHNSFIFLWAIITVLCTFVRVNIHANPKDIFSEPYIINVCFFSKIPKLCGRLSHEVERDYKGVPIQLQSYNTENSNFLHFSFFYNSLHYYRSIIKFDTPSFEQEKCDRNVNL